ncbi:acetyltransferase [Massilia sp. YIM B04103]|uniref:acetyltransferase n=1 Tax=Massilia sp. YIM B04103 TaxID=2963106 RepID=UPI0035A6A9E5
MFEIRKSQPGDAPALAEVWRRSVRATHHFLSADDFRQIDLLVSQQYLPQADLWLAVDDAGAPVAFLGLSGTHVDSLFVDPAVRGQGIGKLLLAHVGQMPAALTVDVNEQNAQAVGFYLKQGFVQTGRSATDGDGRPYPLLHLRRAAPPALPPVKEIRVRLATPADIPILFEVRTSVLQNHLSRGQMVEWGVTLETTRQLMEQSPCIWGGEVNGEVVAFATADVEGGSVFAMFIRPGFEGLGLGRRLMAEVEALLFRHHALIWLETDGRDPVRANGFYLKLGWTLAAELAEGDVRYEKRRPA